MHRDNAQLLKVQARHGFCLVMPEDHLLFHGENEKAVRIMEEVEGPTRGSRKALTLCR